MGSLITVILLVAVLSITAIVFIFKNLYYTGSANEIMIFTGTRTKSADGSVHGYRLIKGGRAIRKPILERIDRISLSNMSIDVTVRGAYSKGGIPLNVVGVANVKVAGEEPYIHHAIERFLGKRMDEIREIAQETLEGNLRGVLAELTPEEVNQDKTRFAQNLMKQAEEDLLKLGLELDNLKIQNVTDDKGYLDSIGRISSADLQKKAIIGEAESKADATIKAAQAKLGIALSQVEKEMKVVKANAEKRIKVAQTNKIAMVNEVRSATGTEMARARADLNVQQARIIQVQKELEADLIQPAMAASEAAIQDAKAKAAKIIADGHASAEALREVTATWKAAGPYARDVFLMPKLQGIINTLVLNTIGDINISKISMVNGGGAQIVAPTADGDSKAVATVPPLPTKLHQFNEQMKATMGVDVSKILERTVGKKD